eukprot:TRINITY_DN118_c0_g2_i2.p1 TRINITY_DN118_c0_g2~~TRINITY_DN118_c0_g2_i2.p1  ORF type:complete len:189 (+),score=22.35 TRINITY_DN118_c0_g2_i2:2-568(+)
MIRRPPRSTRVRSSAASDVYKRQVSTQSTGFGTKQPKTVKNQTHTKHLIKMRRVLAGPGTNNHVAKKDIGKEAPSGGGADGYRRAAVATGPGASHGQYTATQDIGKMAPASVGADGYRRAAVATGPGASHGQYTATQDIGKLAPAASTDGYRHTATAVGPASSHGQYTATQDIGKQLPAAGETYWEGK